MIIIYNILQTVMTDFKEIIEVAFPGPYYLCKLLFFFLTFINK